MSILPADPKHTASATANQALKWLTFRVANGSLSERRAYLNRTAKKNGALKKFEDLREAHEYMSVRDLSSGDGEVDLRISPRRLRA